HTRFSRDWSSDVCSSDLQTNLGLDATNFTVLRLRRDVFSRSSVGALFANRSVALAAEGSNQTYGVDGNFSFRQDVTVAGYYAETRTSGTSGDDRSWMGRLEYAGDLLGATVSHLRS